MAENESNTAVAEQEFQYNVKVEDAGPGTKKVTVDVSQERINEKLAEQFKELRQHAAIPGFRPGHVPAKLIEKKFATDVRDQVRKQLISESYEQAVTKQDIKVLGEPEFIDPEGIKLPDAGGMSYSFTIEIQPEFTIPDLANLKVKKPKVDVTEANVDQAMQNLKEQQGTLVPVEDRGVDAGDYLLTDVHVKLDGNIIAHQHDAQLVARTGRIGGIEIPNLADELKGAKDGDTKTFKAAAPDNHPNEQLRGKEVEIEVKIKSIKRLELAELNEEFLESLGFTNETELRDALREQLVERISFDVQQAMRNQVHQYLLEGTHIELPAKLSQRQASRVVNRRAIDLMMRGMPREAIEQNIQQLSSGADLEAARELKLFFILQKIATEQEVDVDEAELNGRIAILAAQRGERPEKLKQTMAKDGSLANLYVQMREHKAVDKLLEKAQIEEVDVPQPAVENSAAEGEKK
jgi:trigger factor